MDQYRPAYKAHDYEKLRRSANLEEYKEVVDLAKNFGLERGETFRHSLRLW